jgi:hypothetical protein
LRAAQWFAAEYLIPARFTGWDGVRAKQVHEWTIILLGRYSDCYASNQFRALAQFFKWHATEDPDEPRHGPRAGPLPARAFQAHDGQGERAVAGGWCCGIFGALSSEHRPAGRHRAFTV